MLRSAAAFRASKNCERVCASRQATQASWTAPCRPQGRVAHHAPPKSDFLLDGGFLLPAGRVAAQSREPHSFHDLSCRPL